MATSPADLTSADHENDAVEALLALRERVRAAWTPDMDAPTVARLRALEAEVDEVLEEASIQAHRAKERAAATAAALRRTRMWFVHAGGHFGPCSDTRSFALSEAELRSVAGSGVWHLDPSQQRPEWWPAPVLVDMRPEA